MNSWLYVGTLEGRGVDGVVHILDSLLDLELLGVELVFEFVNGAFEFADLKLACKTGLRCR